MQIPNNIILIGKKWGILLLILTVTALNNLLAQSDLKVGITPGVINTSAVFEAESTNKGMLIPRMTSAQMTAIASPATGLMVFNTDLGCMHVYRSGVWRNMCVAVSDSAWTLTGNSGTVDGTNFIGTTDNVPLSIKVNNQKAGRIDNTLLNTSLGYLSSSAMTTGNSNTAIGQYAMRNSTIANFNTAVGVNALLSNTGDYNVGIGNSALRVSSGSNNLAIGVNTLQANTSGNANVAVGAASSTSNTTGSSNTMVGYGTFLNNTTGSSNTGIGESSIRSNTTGQFNNALGSWALYGNTTGNQNVAIGGFSMNGNVAGSNNVALGSNSLYNANSDGNVAVGHYAATRISSGTYNTLLGKESGDYVSIGNRNVIIGYQSGSTVSTGSNNTLIGTGANVSVGGSAFTNATALGYNATVGASNSLVLGNSVNVGINSTTPQYKLDIDAQTGSAGNPLRLLGLNAGAISDSIISSNGGILRRLSIADIVAAGSNAWSLTGNSGTTAGTNFLGTTDAQDLVFRTSNSERLKILSGGTITQTGNNQVTFTGNVDATNGLDVTTAALTANAGSTLTGTTTINTTGASGTSIGNASSATTVLGATTINTSGTATTSIGNSGSTVTVAGTIGVTGATSINTSGSLTTNIGTGAATGTITVGNTANTVSIASDDIQMANLPTYTSGNDFLALNASNQIEKRTISNIVTGTGTATRVAFWNSSSALTSNSNLLWDNTNSRLGIGATAAAYKLDVDAMTGSAGNPLRLQGLSAGATTDSILTSSSGVVRRMSMNSLAWALTGNSGTTAGTNFVGNTDNISLTFKTNSVRSGYLGTNTDNNVFMGYNAGATISTGTTNTLLGATADVSTGTFSNATALGYGASVDASNKIRLGNTSVTLVETYGSFVTVSDRRLKTNIENNAIGLNFIKAIHPVQYELKAQKGTVYDGFIAQEIEDILKKQNIKNFSGLSKPNTEGGYYSVSYSTFVVPLVNAVKELDTKNEQLAAENASLKAEIAKMKADNANLKISVDANTQAIQAIKAELAKKTN